MNSYFYEEVLPSLKYCPKVIGALKNNKISNISRIGGEGNISLVLKENPKALKNEVFNILSSPIRLHLDNGDIVAFALDAIKDSVVAWFDLKSGVEGFTSYYFKDYSEYIFYDDPIFGNKDVWSNIIGSQIEKILILTVDTGKREYMDDSFQCVVVLECDKSDLVISDQFYKVSGYENSIFTIGNKKDLPQEVWNKATVFEL
ncbi:hypothetical protein MSP8887_03237 [Marinomonas spartinae]|uniref:hypothetical protein n=1 Tax=Marinomonas spartinae TaxID=1792290 RepID=UPI000808CFAD|nr:hypothetical protein [Marinomonas spartinae]SBS38242.1 hypothetical protein MSP8887_03237 [Marinomonas spartinae]